VAIGSAGEKAKPQEVEAETVAAEPPPSGRAAASSAKPFQEVAGDRWAEGRWDGERKGHARPPGQAHLGGPVRHG